MNAGPYSRLGAALVGLVVLLSVPVRYGQAQTPHVRLEPHVVVPFAEIDGDPTSTTVYGLRGVVAWNRGVALYAGHSVGRTDDDRDRPFFDPSPPDDWVSQTTVGFRFVTGLSRPNGLFASMSVGAAFIDNGSILQGGANVGVHVEYWLVPQLVVRSGVELGLANDGIYGTELGVAFVPFRF
jgi:hypothetical protein